MKKQILEYYNNIYDYLQNSINQNINIESPKLSTFDISDENYDIHKDEIENNINDSILKLSNTIQSKKKKIIEYDKRVKSYNELKKEIIPSYQERYGIDPSFTIKSKI